MHDEASRRRTMWQDLLTRGGPTGVSAAVLRELGIYGGAQGIWVDKARTGAVTVDGHGVTVGLLHTGARYADEMVEDGMIYHYPTTRRPPSRDEAEVVATKHARTLGLPVFVISKPTHTTRDVHLGWVVDWDDKQRVFAVVFRETPPPIATKTEQHTFELKTSARQKRVSVASARPGQAIFRFRVLKRYGAECVLCGLKHPAVLDAAHLCPVDEGGTDDPRNGLPLCATHHRAFDAGLLGIEPDSLCVRIVGTDYAALGITRLTLDLQEPPHAEALGWAWRRWQQGREQDQNEGGR